ncbi:MAG TPA: DUF1837 domain-containing protein [Candidatus Angelobacter sp.]|nr:DUF1837 domain-containing protein [Candidatus Angelobacter sp.]
MPELTGACAGYEAGRWRCEELAAHLIEWLPEFALRYREWNEIRWYNANKRLKEAARTVYRSKRYRKRGEVGEILLHVLIRQSFSTIPAISKYFYKDSANDTVKGFDAVHVVISGNDIELWLGEVKFYKNVKAAIRAAVKELRRHLRRNYLRAEFAAITNKVDETWKHANKIKELISSNTSLDRIFTRICIPVLLAYDSKTVARHKRVSPEFLKEFEEEVRQLHAAFAKNTLPRSLRIHLFLAPLGKKTDLTTRFHECLTKLQ